MALFYWVGKTANGNVNIAANWSLWGSCGGQTALPPEALTIPKYNDNLAFSRYGIGSTGIVYPIYGPSGELNGLCGPAGNTSGQYCPNIIVYETCPVPLGTTSSYFKVGAGFINIVVPSSGGPEYAYYLDLKDNQGVTKPNADVRIYSKKQHDFNIKGYANSVFTSNLTTAPSYANVYLRDIELAKPNYTVYNQGLNSYDIFYLYKSTSATTAQLYLDGKGPKAYIEKGWAWSDPTITIKNTNTNMQIYGRRNKNIAEPVLIANPANEVFPKENRRYKSPYFWSKKRYLIEARQGLILSYYVKKSCCYRWYR